MTDCWFGRENQGSLKHTRCDHTSYVDRDGTKWQRFTFPSTGKTFSIAFYGKEGEDISRAKMQFPGQPALWLDAYVDKDGDPRISFDGKAEFAFKYSDNPRVSSIRRGLSGATTTASYRRPRTRNVEVEELLQGF